MYCPGIYVVTYLCVDGQKHHSTVEAQCSLAALGIIIEAERQAGCDVVSGSAELLVKTDHRNGMWK